MKAFPHTETQAAVRMLRQRAEMYRHFLPEWPALAESFEREAAALAEKLKGRPA